MNNSNYLSKVDDVEQGQSFIFDANFVNLVQAYSAEFVQVITVRGHFARFKVYSISKLTSDGLLHMKGCLLLAWNNNTPVFGKSSINCNV